MTPDWMDWDGWRWVSAALSMAIGFYFGWDMRGVLARRDLVLERNRLLTLGYNALASHRFVEQMASFTDPRDTVDNQDEEIEAFAAMIRKAKAIAGDLSPEGDDAE